MNFMSPSAILCHDPCLGFKTSERRDSSSIQAGRMTMGRYRLPGAYLTADIVIFTIRGGRLEILLIERGGEPFQGCWALPGGFVEHDEDVDEAARRELEEETGVKGLSLEQLHTFGAPDRDPRGRVVTVAFYTLVPAGRLSPRAGDDAARAQWFDADNLPRLAFDHAAIVALRGDASVPTSKGRRSPPRFWPRHLRSPSCARCTSSFEASPSSRAASVSGSWGSSSSRKPASFGHMAAGKFASIASNDLAGRETQPGRPRR